MSSLPLIAVDVDGSYLGRGEIPFLKSSDLPSALSTQFLNSFTTFCRSQTSVHSFACGDQDKRLVLGSVLGGPDGNAAGVQGIAFRCCS